MVPFWKEAMEMVLDVEPGKCLCHISPIPCSDILLSDEDSSRIPDVSIVEASAELLYGLVHQRYILTRAGLQAMVGFGWPSNVNLTDSTTRTGREVRKCSVWGLSARLLRRVQRRPLRPL